MPRSRYRQGRKDHNKRIKAHRIATQQELLQAGQAIIARQVEQLTPRHEPLIPFAMEAVNG